jgi:hypothetical protein
MHFLVQALPVYHKPNSVIVNLSLQINIYPSSPNRRHLKVMVCSHCGILIGKKTVSHLSVQTSAMALKCTVPSAFVHYLQKKVFLIWNLSNIKVEW